jgi:DNA mismatch repair protein MutL
MEYFNSFGFDIVTEEADEFAITAVPLLLNGPLSTGFFSDILDNIDQVGFSKESAYDHKTELIALAACKAAVKGGDSLAEAEARALITQLLELENPFTCPHGRPTIVEFTRQELERRFKRS